MSDKSQTTTFWNPDCPIAKAAKAQQVQLDWINAGTRLAQARKQLAKAQDEYDLAFRRYSGNARPAPLSQ